METETDSGHGIQESAFLFFSTSDMGFDVLQVLETMFLGKYS